MTAKPRLRIGWTFENGEAVRVFWVWWSPTQGVGGFPNLRKFYTFPAALDFANERAAEARHVNHIHLWEMAPSM